MVLFFFIFDSENFRMFRWNPYEILTVNGLSYKKG